jgi:hypothetical protein
MGFDVEGHGLPAGENTTGDHDRAPRHFACFLFLRRRRHAPRKLCRGRIARATARRANQSGSFATGESSPFAKNISVFPKRKSVYIVSHPAPLEGRHAIVTVAGRDAMGADGAKDEGA